ncbi:MAG: prolipoprotein diacylglyceryl transferase [Chitinophagales bacterium]
MGHLAAITWNPDPVAFELFGPLAFTWYGLTWSLSMLVGYYLATWMFTREHIDGADPSNVVTTIFLSCLVGARLGQVIFYDLDYFVEYPSEIFKVWNGGLASHGAVIAAILSVYYLSKKNRSINFLWLVDRMAITVLAAGSFIRFGNFMNSELYGTPTGSDYGVIFTMHDMIPRHPVQLYESVWLMICFLAFMGLYMKLKEWKDGFFACLFLSVVFTGRLLLEFMKANPDLALGLSRTQWLSVPMILIGLGGLIFLKRQENHTQD